MNIFNRTQTALLLACITTPLSLLAATAPGGGAAASTDYTAKPPAVIESADPLILIDLSVELTQQAEAYTDGDLSYGPNQCPDRKDGRGICYFDNYDYIGYFDPKKCYEYISVGAESGAQTAQSPYTGPAGGVYRGSTPNPVAKPNRDFFEPSSLAKPDHTCAGTNEWSGNYLNWATMSAIDEFRAAMTGGARLIDTAGANAETLLVNNYDKSWSFVPKAIGRDDDKITKNSITFDHDSSQLTPFDTDVLVAQNHDGAFEHKVKFYDGDGNFLGEYNVIVKVCDPSISLEENCVKYADAGGNTWYKPEGLLQKNAVKMRYALSSYIAQNGTGRDGGVMRALAKYIGYVKPADDGGLEINDAAEVAEDGRFVYNPDNQSIVLGRVTNSGLINYINNFGLGPNGYKANDPVAELYYESLKYFKGLAPTEEYSNNMTDARYDNFPIYNQQSDWTASKPLADVCQTTYKLYVGDQYSHADGDLPGQCVDGASDPSGADSSINTCSLTNTVGTLEGYHAGSLGSRKQSNNSGHWIAGLAYYARTNDLRPEDGIQTIKTFMVDTAEYKTSVYEEEDNKLWLAAKFGGFEDTNDDKNPGKSGPNDVTSSVEWDADGDGVPDTYTVANQPDNLVRGLNAAFAEFSKGAASSSAAAVVSNSAGGTGAIYQALYEPRVTGEGAGEIVDWTGTVISFFIDDKSRFREDCLWDSGTNTCIGEGDQILDDTDPEIKFRATIDSNTSEKIVVYDRYSTSSGAQISTDHAFKEMGVIFDAAKKLSSLDDSKITTQRDYIKNADEGRYIITSLNGVDTVAFDSTTFTQLDSSDSTIDPRRLLGFDSTTEFHPTTSVDLGEALVNFIRGQDQKIDGWRSRKITTKVGATTEEHTKRMGDIINSAPVVVGRPNADYNVRYADPEYAYYIRHYADRRQVAYVGANDGMLHAFNAGFYGNTKGNSPKPTFATSPQDLSSGANPPKSPERHPLGAELWSYVPYNLLPHLQWLKELEYPHVYYMDGDVQSFDVNIFDDCGGAVSGCTHPYGWGTIIVATMRFGGGEITVNTSSDDAADGEATMRSAVVVFDVTDPEQPPTLIAEITHPELGYTTSKPIVYKAREASTDGTVGGLTDKWYLVFGSGPAGDDKATSTAALEEAVSNQSARLFAYDLKNQSFVSGYAPKVLTETNSFVGDLAVMDWDNDYVDDAIYFGTVGGSVSSPTGKLKRFVPDGSPEIADMLNGSNQPYTAAPKPVLDRRGDAWVFAGTGRFFVAGDILSSQQQSYHGIKEDTDKTSYTTTDKVDLVDTTDILIFADGSATAPNTTSDAIVASPSNLVNETATTYSQVRDIVSNSPHGWFIDLGNTAARNLLSATVIRDILLFDEYTPSGNTCAPAGTSRLFNLNMLSGTPSSDIVFATDSDVTNVAKSIQVLGAIDMGDGQIIGISAHRDTAVVGMGGGSGSGGFRMESNTATIGKIPFGRRSWREIPYQ